jgi:hypothetical protein
MTHYRTRFKARTVLMAADGVATRAITREQLRDRHGREMAGALCEGPGY